MGQTLHTFTALAHNHKYTQEVTDKGGMATRDRERERCVCDCARESEREKKRQWAATNMSGQCGTNITSSDSVHSDTQSAIVTHRHASRDIFFPQQRPHAHRVAHTYMQICVQTHFGREQRASADTNTDTQLNKQTHADTHKGVKLISHCVCLLALFHPSHHDSQSLRITATSASTEKSMVKHINKNTIKPIESKATSGPLKWCFPPAEGADELLSLGGGREEGGVMFPLLVLHHSPHSLKCKRDCREIFLYVHWQCFGSMVTSLSQIIFVWTWR